MNRKTQCFCKHFKPRQNNAMGLGLSIWHSCSLTPSLPTLDDGKNLSLKTVQKKQKAKKSIGLPRKNDLQASVEDH